MTPIALYCTLQSRAPNINRCAPENWPWPLTLTRDLDIILTLTPTDRRYQVHYLPRFAVNKNKLNSILIPIPWNYPGIDWFQFQFCQGSIQFPLQVIQVILGFNWIATLNSIPIQIPQTLKPPKSYTRTVTAHLWCKYMQPVWGQFPHNGFPVWLALWRCHPRHS